MKCELSRNPDFYKHDIAFCLVGVSFVHKQNPPQAAAGTRSWIWRKKKEGLQFTAKGSKHLAGGPRLHLIVAIAHGKGVVLKKVYEKQMDSFIPILFGHISISPLRDLDQNGMGMGSLSLKILPCLSC